MVDRNDIDALLIGSLYGELSSAEEARLKAHLESHPGDRTALDGLSRTRDALRASRIFEHQAEPPQSVSALLLQEAARRAPRKADGEREGWFARLRRSFLMSPAFAAATMLVVVAGVAGTIYMRQGDHFAEPEVAASAEQAAGSAALAAPVAAAPAAEPEPAEGAAAPAQAQAAQPAPDSIPPAGDRLRGAEGSYRVGLADGKDSLRSDEQAKADTAAAPEPPKAAKPARKAGPGSLLEVSTPQRAPKELEDARPTMKKTAAKGRAPSREYARPADDLAPAAEPVAAGKLGNAPAAPVAPAPRASSAASPPPPPAAAVAQDFSKAPAGPSGGAAGGSVIRSAGGEEKVAADADVAWAREQHSRLLGQIKAGRCGDAAGTAVALSNRAPGYYQQNVENDRAVKSCLAYINAERERAAERAQRARATTRQVTSEDAATAKKATAPRKAAPAKQAPPARSAPATTDAAPAKRD